MAFPSLWNSPRIFAASRTLGDDCPVRNHIVTRLQMRYRACNHVRLGVCVVVSHAADISRPKQFLTALLAVYEAGFSMRCMSIRMPILSMAYWNFDGRNRTASNRSWGPLPSHMNPQGADQSAILLFGAPIPCQMVQQQH